MGLESIRFDKLDHLPIETLYAAFVEAFSDYSVPMTLSLDDFRVMNLRRGVNLASSVGAFDGDRLVGFILNGAGIWQGKLCAYDAGTGILPDHRGIGLSKALAHETMMLLRVQGYSRWLLEVLVGNDKAIRTYKGSGFSVTRRFSCPMGKVADAAALADESAARTRVEIVALEGRDARRFASFRDWEPSWQNSDDSLERSPEKLLFLGARGMGVKAGSTDASAAAPMRDEILGYIAATEKGSVFQLAVRPDMRRRGIGKTLVAALAARVADGRVRYINVLSDDSAQLDLLGSLGLRNEVDQWEMMLDFQ